MTYLKDWQFWLAWIVAALVVGLFVRMATK